MPEDVMTVLKAEFEDICKEASKERFVSNFTNYIGHITLNGRVMEITLSLEADVDEMLVDPMSKDMREVKA